MKGQTFSRDGRWLSMAEVKQYNEKKGKKVNIDTTEEVIVEEKPKQKIKTDK